jgi:hypothetical protein
MVMANIRTSKSRESFRGEDRVKRNEDIREHLIDKHLVHDANPFDGRTAEDVKRTLDSQGTEMRDRMQETKGKNDEIARAKFLEKHGDNVRNQDQIKRQQRAKKGGG